MSWSKLGPYVIGGRGGAGNWFFVVLQAGVACGRLLSSNSRVWVRATQSCRFSQRHSPSCLLSSLRGVSGLDQVLVFGVSIL